MFETKNSPEFLGSDLPRASQDSDPFRSKLPRYQLQILSSLPRTRELCGDWFALQKPGLLGLLGLVFGLVCLNRFLVWIGLDWLHQVFKSKPRGLSGEHQLTPPGCFGKIVPTPKKTKTFTPHIPRKAGKQPAHPAKRKPPQGKPATCLVSLGARLTLVRRRGVRLRRLRLHENDNKKHEGRSMGRTAGPRKERLLKEPEHTQWVSAGKCHHRPKDIVPGPMAFEPSGFLPEDANGKESDPSLWAELVFPVWVFPKRPSPKNRNTLMKKGRNHINAQAPSSPKRPWPLGSIAWSPRFKSFMSRACQEETPFLAAQ